MIKVSITTQKGGTGKSTLTSFLANQLCFQHHAKVLIVDCDPPQSTIYSNWRAEISMFETIKNKKRNEVALENAEAVWAKEYEKTLSHGFKKIDVISIEDVRLKRDFKKLDTVTAGYDVVLYDLPGSLENVKLLYEMLTFDYIFIPIEPDRKAGTMSTATAAALYILKERLKKTDSMKSPNISLFFNKVNVSSVRHKKAMLQLYTTACKKGFEFLCSADGIPLYIDSRVIYQDDLICSLFINTYSRLRYTKVDTVLQTILNIMGYGCKEKRN